jgi:alkylation response protein AidB-like acyl-CoA dehydrogenase
MLLESTRRLMTDQYDAHHRQQILASPEGRSIPVWTQFAELGLLGLNVPEEEGGIGGDAIGTLLVSMALGEALIVEPYWSSAVLASRAIARLSSQAQRSQWLPRLAAGEMIAVVAHEETGMLHSDPPTATRATPAEGLWILQGRKAAVYHAPLADMLLVSATVAGGGGLEWGLFAVPRDTPGAKLEVFTTVDGQRAANIVLDHVQVPANARIGTDVSALLPPVLDYGLAALCAETLGTLDRLLAITLEYTRTRVQFGGPIGRFQALQHRMADMLTHVEQSRSMTYLAASSCQSAVASERTAALSAAKVVLGRAARFVGQQAIQLHGGMGMSDEMPASHYFKRLLAFELRGGHTEAHLERYATLSIN